MEGYRLDMLLTKVREVNPQAYPFCQALGELAALVDNVNDKDLPPNSERISRLILEVVKMTHTNEWVKPRLVTILTMWELSHIYWIAANGMEQSPLRGFLKDKFNDILVWAIAETQTEAQTADVIRSYPFEQT